MYVCVLCVCVVCVLCMYVCACVRVCVRACVCIVSNKCNIFKYLLGVSNTIKMSPKVLWLHHKILLYVVVHMLLCIASYNAKEHGIPSWLVQKKYHKKYGDACTEKVLCTIKNLVIDNRPVLFLQIFCNVATSHYLGCD